MTQAEISRLSPSERLALICDLWDSLDEAALTLPASQRRELEHRLATFEQDKAAAVDWEDLKAELAVRAP